MLLPTGEDDLSEPLRPSLCVTAPIFAGARPRGMSHPLGRLCSFDPQARPRSAGSLSLKSGRRMALFGLAAIHSCGISPAEGLRIILRAVDKLAWP